jgi:hypothetical protein
MRQLSSESNDKARYSQVNAILSYELKQNQHLTHAPKRTARQWAVTVASAPAVCGNSKESRRPEPGVPARVEAGGRPVSRCP